MTDAIHRMLVFRFLISYPKQTYIYIKSIINMPLQLINYNAILVLMPNFQSYGECFCLGPSIDYFLHSYGLALSLIFYFCPRPSKFS